MSQFDLLHDIRLVASHVQADRLDQHFDEWPVGARPGDSSAFTAEAAPIVLPFMFDDIEPLENGLADFPTYHLWAGAVPIVHLCGRSWKWVALDSSTMSRGMITLWAWRFDCDMADAYAAISVLIQAAAEPPRADRRRRVQ